MGLLTVHSLAGQQPGPHLLILAGVHGDEYEPIAAVRHLATSLEAASIRGRVTLVPIVNLPAFQRMQRTGPDDLDLARTFPGKADGSITQQIAYEAADLIRSSDFLIDLHTGGLACRISPLAGYMLHPDPAVCQQQRRMARAFNLPIVWGTTPSLDGRTLSVARDALVPAIYAEWGGGGGCQPAGVEAYVQGCRNVMRELGMSDDNIPPSLVRYLVEDARSESGVLQKNYLAEAAGYFEPIVSLNQIVQAGELLGWIHSTQGEASQPIHSRQAGLVLLLRAIPATAVGDFLAVILEITEPGEVSYE